jgi:predicted GNAT family N-acyltransferase
VATPHPAPFTIEPLGDHRRSSFSCGNTELDRYIQFQASQDARRKVATPFVLVGPGREILGYYTLSAYAVHLPELPQTIARKLPRYPLVPATLLGRLAVSSAHRGRKLGAILLMDALNRSLRATTEVASVGVVAEAIDGAAKQFYLHHEFVPFIDQPNKLILPMVTIAKLFTT